MGASGSTSSFHMPPPDLGATAVPGAGDDAGVGPPRHIIEALVSRTPSAIGFFEHMLYVFTVIVSVYLLHDISMNMFKRAIGPEPSVEMCCTDSVQK